MSTYLERALGAPSSRLYACRAMDALETLSAGLSQTHLSQEAREEIALQVAELMGQLERLLSMLDQADQQAVSGSADGGGTPPVRRAVATRMRRLQPCEIDISR
jgi:hypothetical protein